jgi:hypothetical protein
MLKSVATLILLFHFLTGSPYSQATRHEITGTIVAYHQLLSLGACYHICAGSLIVRVDNPKKEQPEYIRVDFSYPDRHFPNALIEGKKQWRFVLDRTIVRDEPIKQFVRAVDAKTGKDIDSELPAWKLLSGAEDEQLPYGKVIPSYSLAQEVDELVERNK